MSIWPAILKPSGRVAKWLIFLVLLAFLLLNASGQLEPVRTVLDNDNLSILVGEYRLSAYNALNIILTLALLFWGSAVISDAAESQIGRLPRLRASNKALILKFIQIGIYVVAALVALDLIGLDLTTLTVFSGALGIGLGFGLQKVASNFISGLILLMEKSIEVGDLVSLADGTYGFIRRTGARFTLVETFDSKEILVPNEDFITSRVTNWTFSDHKARIEVPVGVAYGSDLERVREVLLESAWEHPRCAKMPEPKCFLRNFGDSAIDFLLLFWIDDVENGRWEPQSDVMFTIWKKFGEADIHIPFPQRDLHIRSGLEASLVSEQSAKGKTDSRN